MKYASKYPFETLLDLILIYYLGIIFFVEPIRFSQKIIYLLFSLVFFVVTTVIGFSFREQMNSFRGKMFSIFISGKFQKMSALTKSLNLVALSILPFFIVSFLEFLLTILFTKAGAITFGFPLPVFSFSSRNFIYPNIFVNFLLFALTIYFLGYSIIHSPNSDQV